MCGSMVGIMVIRSYKHKTMVDIQSATAEIRRGKNKLQDTHIMSASATHGGNNNSSVMNAYVGG